MSRLQVRCTNCARLWRSKPGATFMEGSDELAKAGWSGESGYLLCKRCLTPQEERRNHDDG